MDCNSQIHDELKSMKECTCPFCDRLLVEVDKAVESCCSEQDIETVNGMNTCINCGSVHGCDYVTEYFNFYDNLHRIRQKSTYHRKYHIDNVMNGVSFKNNINLTHKEGNQIHKVFVEIDSVIHKVNNGRKRMISIKFVIMQLFKMLGLPYKDIKRTLTCYKQHWEKVKLLIGDRIQSIINK